MTVQAKTRRVKGGINPRELKKGGAEAGIWAGQAAGEGGASLLEIAIWNELGTFKKSADGSLKRHIPPRPFMKITVEKYKDEWLKLVERVNKLVLEGKIDNRTASEIVGQRIQADIQRTIIELKNPPNAQSTIDKKGSSNPLVDNGALGDGVKYQVVE